MRNLITHEVRNLLLAIGFFTRIPVPSLDDFQESDLNTAAKYFPLVGIIVGIVAAVIFWLALLVLPADIAIVISMVASIYLTGAFHEDGLADATDGLGGGWEKKQVLAIMQDSRIGSYGTIALVLALLGKFLLLRHMHIALLPVVLVVAHAISRLAAVLVMATQSYVRSEGKSKPLATRLGIPGLLVATFFGLLPLFMVIPHLFWSLTPVALVWIWFSMRLHDRLGGYTGDCLGAMQQLTELAFYLGVVIWGAQ